MEDKKFDSSASFPQELQAPKPWEAYQKLYTFWQIGVGMDSDISIWPATYLFILLFEIEIL